MNLKVIIVYINASLIAINWFMKLITIRPIVIFFLHVAKLRGTFTGEMKNTVAT